MSAIADLIKIAGEPLGGRHGNDTRGEFSRHDGVSVELDELFSLRDGFYAFESALHVFPHSAVDGGYSITDWNAPGLWRGGYPSLGDGVAFFAEDVFGCQFGVTEEGVWTFDPETGDTELLASSIEGWAGEILNGFDVLTGHPIAHEWQLRHGVLRPGDRLLPRVPFVLGGVFEVDNLMAVEAVAGMRARAELAAAIRGRADGATVEFAGWNLG